MKEIELTRGLKALVDDDDYEKLIPYKWHASGNEVKKIYAVRHISVTNKKKSIIMHRVVMNYDGPLHIDHIDGNTLNNQKSNLRIATVAQNLQNSKIRNNKTGYKGVRTYKDRFRAYICAGGKWCQIGIYRTAEEAARAYNEAALLYFGEFAKLNIIK